MAEHPEAKESLDKRIELGRGARDTAYPTWWGFDEKEATLYLQAAIDSPAKRVIVPNIGKPWIIRPVWLRSNLELIFEPGVEVIAKRDAFHWVDDCMFSARDAKNITVRGGKGVILKMHKKDYQNPDNYTHSEWRNGLTFLGCSNILIENLTIENTGGDGIYLGTSRQPYCKDVVIRGVECLDNQRQGISIISADNVLIENCTLSNTKGANPQAGIDLEPNIASEIMKNIIIRNVVANNNAGPGFVTYLSPLNEKSEPVSIVFENCIANNNGLPGFLLAFPPVTSAGKSSVKLIGCKALDNKDENLRIVDKPSVNSDLHVKNCSFIKTQAGEKPSILFISSSGNITDVGKVYFENVVTSGNEPFGFSSKSGVIKLLDLKGNIENKNGKKWNLKKYVVPSLFADQTPYLNYTGKYRPVRNVQISKKLPKVKEQKLYMGSPANYVFYAKRGSPVTLEFDYQQFDKYPGVDFSARLYTPTGKNIPVPVMPFKAVTPFVFTAPETGIYRLRVKLWNNRLQVHRREGGISALQLKAAQAFIDASGRFYLNVPAGSKGFAIHLITDSTEHVGATLYNSQGEIFRKIAAVKSRDILKVETRGEKNEVWTLDIYPASHGSYPPANGKFNILFIEIYGVPPLLATTPDGLLEPIK